MKSEGESRMSESKAGPWNRLSPEWMEALHPVLDLCYDAGRAGGWVPETKDELLRLGDALATRILTAVDLPALRREAQRKVFEDARTEVETWTTPDRDTILAALRQLSSRAAREGKD